MNSGAWTSCLEAIVSRRKSGSDRNPSRTLLKLTRAREHSNLRPSDSADISRLNTPTGNLHSTATCSAMFKHPKGDVPGDIQDAAEQSFLQHDLQVIRKIRGRRHDVWKL